MYWVNEIVYNIMKGGRIVLIEEIGFVNFDIMFLFMKVYYGV